MALALLLRVHQHVRQLQHANTAACHALEVQGIHPRFLYTAASWHAHLRTQRHAVAHAWLKQQWRVALPVETVGVVYGPHTINGEGGQDGVSVHAPSVDTNLPGPQP